MTRAAAISMLLLLAVGTLAGAAWRPGDAGTEARPPLVEGLGRPQVVPLWVDGGHLRVAVSPLIGREPWLMLLDTGAPTIVTAAQAELQGATLAGTLAVRAPGSAPAEMDVVLLPELRIGGVTFRDVQAVVADAAANDLIGQGVVGADLMRSSVWQLDQRAGTLTIARDGADIEPLVGAVELAFASASRAAPAPVVELEVGGTTRRFLVDTGSDGGIALHPADLDSPLTALLMPAHVAALDGQRDVSAVRILAEAAIGGRSLGVVSITVSDALDPGLGLIGNGFLSDHLVTIDWPAERLYLAGREAPIGQPVRADQAARARG